MNNTNMEDISFTLTNKDGLDVECDVINSYYDEDSDKLYVAFTDYTLDENDKFNLYINEIIPKNDNYEIKEIEDNNLKLKLIKQTLNNI